MSDDNISPAALRELSEHLRGKGPLLRKLDTAAVGHRLSEAAGRMADAESEEGRELRERLPESTGLTLPMIEWALVTSLQGVAAPALQRMASPPYRPGWLERPASLVSLVLAGNVFTASFRAMALPLLLGSPLLAKASTREDVFPRMLQRALARVDPELGACLQVVAFDRDRDDAMQPLLTESEALVVYGSDETVARFRQRLAGHVRLIAHGHGLGVAYVPVSALVDQSSAFRVAEQVALDVAAYDQRGCLSPHAVVVEPGGFVDAAGFARLLCEHGLAWMDKRLPRGAIPSDVAAAQMQWRGVAAARGGLFESHTHAVGYEGDAPLRASPGYRNVGVYELPDVTALGRWLRPVAPHLKVLGVAGSLRTRRRVAEALPGSLSPRICEVGQMQTPPIDAVMDGRPSWEGLLRWMELS